MAINSVRCDASFESSCAVTSIDTKEDASTFSVTNFNLMLPTIKEYLEAVSNNCNTSVHGCYNAAADNNTDSFKKSSSADDEYSSISDYDVTCAAVTVSDQCSNYTQPTDYTFGRANIQDKKVIIC